MKNGPFEDVFPIGNGIFHCYVSLPEGILRHTFMEVLRFRDVVGCPSSLPRHLFSGYVDYIGEEFGLDGMKAAQGDRFLHEVRGVGTGWGLQLSPWPK